MKIVIETIPYDMMRYATLGDYWIDVKGVVQIRTIKCTQWKDSMLIALHEFVEANLCKAAGIPISAIDAFDIPWHPHEGIAEPGNDPASPYYLQHQAATHMEKMFAAYLSVDWDKYEKRCQSYEIPLEHGPK